ncbi:YcaO-like family protein [Sphingomonas sp. AP4-R1]|uniref:YcaO-like family protein n=1 Tax=Sphingomonas sp. AP4-R1 TaxID=2735134 RepID=UPI0020A2498A|nr:YcaO-like family protein [Sphingomonas sp. AP4-R1]
MWQAVRPRSKALSVHQGKGFDACSARIGALMEAVESACAEAWSGIGPDCSWHALPPGRRSPVVDDFARERGMLDPGETLRWVELVSIGGTTSFFVPESIVSLDLTREDDGRFGRCSTGLAAHFSADGAIRHALHEVIERDARGEWQRRGQAGSLGSRIAIETIAYGWFQELVKRLNEIDVTVRVNRVPGVVPIEVFVVELLDGAEPDRDHAAAGGAGAHEETEAALRAAMLEALQSRLTMIAGARDDLPIRSAHPHRRPLGLGFPTPSFIKEQPLVADNTPPLDDAGAIRKLVGALAAAGYDQVGWLRLSSDESEAIVVKVVVPGLGDLWRERRDAATCMS